MKQPVRSFALGLLSAGIILITTFYFTDTNSKTKIMSTDDLIEKVEADGYHVLTESEYISVSVQTDQTKQRNENEEGSNSAEKQENEADTEENPNDNQDKNSTSEGKSKVTYTLTVKSGMTPSSISTILVENNIIDNSDDFTQYLEEEGYSTKVQLGEFDLTSEMSHYDIAEQLTN